MYPSYQGIHRTLSSDDINGVTGLYPSGPVPSGSLSGTVSDANGPIANATVSTTTGQSDDTDANGIYSIADVPAGDVTLTASASGYESEASNVIVVDGQNTVANFTLTALPQGNTVSVASITYSTSGGRGGTKNLRITIALEDDNDVAVANASVTIELDLAGEFWGSGSATTGTDGTATFQARNAEPGHYSTEVTDVSAAGLTWDGITLDNGYDKAQ
jgi:hypothetical protein